MRFNMTAFLKAVCFPNINAPTGTFSSTGTLFYAAAGTGAAGARNPGVSIIPNYSLTFTTNTPTGIGISVTTGPTGAIVNIDNSLQQQVIQNTQTIQQLQVTSQYSTTETLTGATYNGKPIYRRAFNANITQGVNQQNDYALISTAGYVDAIVNSGGYWATGNGQEKYAVNTAYVAPNSLYGFVYVNTQNQLYFRSNSSLSRTNAPAFIWVEYTKV